MVTGVISVKNGDLRQRAEEIACKNKASVLASPSLEEIQRLYHELQVHQVELEMQNAELRRTQHELESSRERYFDLFQLAPVGYLTLNEYEVIIETNLTVATLLGVERGTLLKKPFNSFILPEFQDTWYLRHNKYSESNDNRIMEIMMIRAGAFPFWAYLKEVPLDNGECRLILMDISIRKHLEETQKNERMFDTILQTTIEGFWVVDLQGRFQKVNDAYCKMIGYSRDELLGMAIKDVEALENQTDIEQKCNDIARNGNIHFQSRHRCKDGRIIDLDISANYLENDNVLFTFLHDITTRCQAEKVNQARLRINEYLFSHSLDELLTKILDEAEILTDSQIGFFHFLDADQVTLSLQTWSSRTLTTICTAEGKGHQYPLESAGIWCDCIRLKKPVIHNNYEMLPHRKGLPTGHATILRELVVPIFRNNLIVAVLGVGNKYTDYTNQDTETIVQLANLTWDIVERKQAEIALMQAHEELESKVAERTSALALTNEQMNKVSLELVWAEERERERIAGELHDQVGQSLLLAKMKLDALSDKIPSGPLRTHAEEASSLLENSIHDIRSLTFRMRPPILDTAEIETVLKWLC